MQREPNIAWRKSQQQKLSRSVAKFNAKITREMKKHPEFAEYYPEKLSTKQLKESIKTAKDLNNLVNKINRAFKTDSFTPIMTEKGVKTTKFEVNEAKLGIRRINTARRKEREKAAPSTEKGTMGTIKNAALNPKSFDINKMSSIEWDKFKGWIDKEIRANSPFEKAEKYKSNYLKAVNDVFGSDSVLIEKLGKIPANKLIEMFYDDPILQIDFIYDPKTQSEIELAVLEHLEFNGY